jgi:hypothetical protein
MPSNAHTYVTSDDFSRYIMEENNFRSRLEQRLASDHELVRKDLGEIKGLVKETNGRVGNAERTIAVLEREVSAMKSEGQEIEATVHSIKDEGCSQLAQHAAILEAGGTPAFRPEFRLDHFSVKQKAVAGAGIALVMWPAIQEIATLIHDLVLWLEKQ